MIESDRLIARCTPELMGRAPELGSPEVGTEDPTPVLILGMPDQEGAVVLIKPDLKVPNGGKLF